MTQLRMGLLQCAVCTPRDPLRTDGVKHSSIIFSFVLHLTNVLLPNTSNLDLSVHHTFFPHFLCPMCVLLPILIFSFSWLSLVFFFDALPRTPASYIPLFWCCWGMFFGYHLMKLPVEELWGICYSNQDSDVLVLLLRRASESSTSLSVLVRDSLCWSLMGEVHTDELDLKLLNKLTEA